MVMSRAEAIYLQRLVMSPVYGAWGEDDLTEALHFADAETCKHSSGYGEPSAAAMAEVLAADLKPADQCNGLMSIPTWLETQALAFPEKPSCPRDDLLSCRRSPGDRLHSPKSAQAAVGLPH